MHLSLQAKKLSFGLSMSDDICFNSQGFAANTVADKMDFPGI